MSLIIKNACQAGPVSFQKLYLRRQHVEKITVFNAMAMGADFSHFIALNTLFKNEDANVTP